MITPVRREVIAIGLRSAPLRLAVNPVPCTACMSCQLVCSQRRTGDQDPRSSGIRIELDPFGGNHLHRFCRQCRNAACAESCPQNAIVRESSTQAMVIIKERCDRCGRCLDACPYNAIFWWSDSRGPVKCDLCGGNPRCVEACNFGVIRYLRPDDSKFDMAEMPPEEQDPGLGRGSGE